MYFNCNLNKVEMKELIEMLLEKVKPTSEIDFNRDGLVNLEGEALAYIYVTLLIVLYNSKHIDQELITEEDFLLLDWTEVMQDHLRNVKIATFGW